MEELNTRYEITGEPIGKGAFGEVYIGIDKYTNKIKAIKIMNLADQYIFKNELDVLKKILAKNCFRHIICLTDYFIYDDKLILITDKIEGISLNEYLIKRLNEKLNKEELMYVIYQLIYAIGYIHKELKVAHLDIKPANIIIDPDTLKLSIIDFGLACENKCIKGGTLKYMAPEYYLKFKRKENVYIKDGMKNDMYAIGLIIYEMIFGRDSLIGYKFDKELELTEQYDKYEKLYDNISNNIEKKNEYKEISKELIYILKNTLTITGDERISSKNLLKYINPWYRIYEQRIRRDIKTGKQEEKYKFMNIFKLLKK